MKTLFILENLHNPSGDYFPDFPSGDSKPQWFQAPGESLEFSLPAGHQA